MQGEGIAQPGSYFWACNRSSCWIRFIPSWGGSVYRFGLCFPIISKVGVLRNESENQLIELLKSHSLPVELAQPLSMEEIKLAMMNDKKVRKELYDSL